MEAATSADRRFSGNSQASKALNNVRSINWFCANVFSAECRSRVIRALVIQPQRRRLSVVALQEQPDILRRSE